MIRARHEKVQHEKNATQKSSMKIVNMGKAQREKNATQKSSMKIVDMGKVQHEKSKYEKIATLENPALKKNNIEIPKHEKNATQKKCNMKKCNMKKI